MQVGEEGCGPLTLNLSVEPVADRLSHSTLLLALIEPAGTSSTPLPVDSDPSVFALSEESRKRIQLREVELQHARESLQTAVEELETSNGELHSVNEGCSSVNAEHEHKIPELHEVAGDLPDLMHATAIATVFTDREHRIRQFTPAALAVFNLLPQDIGRDIRPITSRTPRDDVFEQIRQVAETGHAADARVTTLDGSTHLRSTSRISTWTGRRVA